MCLSPFRVLVFDLDDTLYLERHYVMSGFRDVSRWIREACQQPDRFSDVFFRACWSRFSAGQTQFIFDSVLRQFDLPPTWVERCVARYRFHFPQIDLLPDARQCLNAWAARGTTSLALITDGQWGAQLAKIGALGLSQQIPLRICTDRWGSQYWKPHERAFVAVERRTGCRGSQLVYVGDNPVKDFTVPLQRGWQVLRVRRPDSLHASKSGDTERVPEIDDLRPLTLLAGKLATAHPSPVAC